MLAEASNTLNRLVPGQALLGALVGLLLGPFALFLFFWPRGNNE